MAKDYRIFENEQGYTSALKYSHEGAFMPQDIVSFPAYVIYDECENQWYAVDRNVFVQYLYAMQDELCEQTEEIDDFLTKW